LILLLSRWLITLFSLFSMILSFRHRHFHAHPAASAVRHQRKDNIAAYDTRPALSARLFTCCFCLSARRDMREAQSAMFGAMIAISS